MPNNGVNILNAIRGVASQDYQNRVPVATQNNIEQVGNPIMEYQATENEFLDLLVNRIALVIVNSKIARNELALLKKGKIPLGQDIQDIFVNMAKAKTYDPDGKNLLQRQIPDVKAVYYSMNRQDMYKVTISNDQLALAFTSYEELEKLIAGIVNSLYSGDNYDEYLLTKGLIESSVNGGLVTTQVVADPTSSQANANAFIKAVKTASGKFKFPSSNYNKYQAYATAKGLTNVSPVVTWTPTEDQIIIIPTEVLASVDVDSLAMAFNLSKVEFLAKTVEVDKIDDDGNIVALLCDKSFFQVYDNREQMTEFYNGEGLYWSYMWHKWGTYAVSPFANSVAFVLQAPATEQNPTAITLTTPSSLTMQVGDTSNIGITFTPSTGDVNHDLTYASSDTSVAKVTRGGRIKAIGAGSATITITSTPTAEETTPVATTVSVTVTE